MFDSRLKSLRQSFGLTIEKQAEIFHVKRQTLSNWENGTGMPSVNKIIEIAQYYHVTVDFLLDLDDRQTIDYVSLPLEIRSHFQLLINDFEQLAKTRDNLLKDYNKALKKQKDQLENPLE